MKTSFFLLAVSLLSFGFSQESMIVKPKLISQKAPDYPQSARQLRMEGVVSLNVQINKDGKVKESELAAAVFTVAGKKIEIFSFGDIEKMETVYRPSAASLIENAKKSVLSWKFSPAKIDREAIDVTIAIPFTYKLSMDQAEKKGMKKETKK